MNCSRPCPAKSIAQIGWLFGLLCCFFGGLVWLLFQGKIRSKVPFPHGRGDPSRGWPLAKLSEQACPVSFAQLISVFVWFALAGPAWLDSPVPLEISLAPTCRRTMPAASVVF